MERQAYDRLLQKSLVRRDTMGGLCRLLHRVFPRPGVLSLEGRQAHMQCTLAKKKNEIKTRSKRDQNEIKPRSKRDQNEITDRPLKTLGYFGPTCAEPAPTSSLTSAPAPINPLPHPLFDSISHLRTPAAQARLLSPAHTRQPNNKHPLKRTRSALQTRQVSPGERKSKVPTRTSCGKRDVKSQDCETHCKRS